MARKATWQSRASPRSALVARTCGRGHASPRERPGGAEILKKLSLFNLESIKTYLILLGSVVSRVSNPWRLGIS